MASITMTVGNLSSTVSISDARFMEYARALVWREEFTSGVPVGETNQEKLDWLVRMVARHVRAEARKARERELEAEDQAVIEEEFEEKWV